MCGTLMQLRWARYKQHPDFTYVNKYSLSDLATGISDRLRSVERAAPWKEKGVEPLGHICGYMMIPFGIEGYRYVKEKIYPKTLEAFMWESAQDLLKAANMFEKEECSKFIALVREYCRDCGKNEVPFTPVGAAVLITRCYSEMTKVPFRVCDRDKDPEYSARLDAHILHYLKYFRDLSKEAPEVLNVPYHVEQAIAKQPGRGEFVFTDEHRKIIDSLPIFTGFQIEKGSVAK